MLGAIIGDIIGSRFEFSEPPKPGFKLFTPECSYTDDTICTIAIADAIMNGKSYRDALLEWCRRYPHPMGSYGGKFYEWINSDNPQPYNSFGNGSAMRVSPVAYYAKDIEECKKLSREVTEITHNHPEGIKGAEATTVATYMALHGSNKDEIRDYLERDVARSSK